MTVSPAARTVLGPRSIGALDTLYAPPAALHSCRARLLERLPPALRPRTRWLLIGPARSGDAALRRGPSGAASWSTACCGAPSRWARLPFCCTPSTFSTLVGVSIVMEKGVSAE